MNCSSILSSTPEWKRANAAPSGSLLPERRVPPAAPPAEADVCDQLHGDGQSDGCAAQLPALQRAADQSRLSAAATSKTDRHGGFALAEMDFEANRLSV